MKLHLREACFVCERGIIIILFIKLPRFEVSYGAIDMGRLTWQATAV